MLVLPNAHIHVAVGGGREVGLGTEGAEGIAYSLSPPGLVC